MWHSKTLGEGGDVHKFLERVCQKNEENFEGAAVQRLAKARGLPPGAFKGYGIGFDGKYFTIPVRDFRGKVVDVRRWIPGLKMQATAGCSLMLFGADKLAQSNQRATVYLCEGEWDAIALNWLLTRVKYPPKDAVVVAVPGSGIFKDSWADYFQERTVHTVYDNDAAGEEGELLARERLTGVAKKVTYTHWMSKLPDKFDLRDWITNGANKRKIPNKCWSALQELFDNGPRRSDPLDDDPSEQEEVKSRYTTPATVEQVYSVFTRWLSLRSTEMVRVSLAAVLSQEIPGDPVWLFLVGPPGSAKSEICTAISRDEKVFTVSSLTPHSLISGAVVRHDPSLIPKLDGRVLVIKDFTAILALSDNDRAEIFGILRDAYDGYCGKVFGNGISRTYQSRFTIISGVTPKIYSFADQNQALGERFLKYLVGDNLYHYDEDGSISRAMTNVSSEVRMRDEIQDVVQSFLAGARARIAENPLPVLSPTVHARVIALAKYCARLRGTVDRDRYRQEMLTAKPSAEIATRLAKQLTKFAMSLCMVNGTPEAGEEEYDIIRRVATNTIPQRRDDMMYHLYRGTPTAEDAMRTKDLMTISKYPFSTVQRMMDDLAALDVVQRAGKSNSWEWALTPYVRKLVSDCNLYETERIQRYVPRARITLRRKRIKYVRV